MNETYRSQFRLPFDLADKLREAAEAAGRSMNAEIVARLQASFGGSLQGSLGGLVTAGQARVVQGEPLTPEQLQLAQAVATEAVKHVVLQAQGLRAMEFGTPSVVQGPPPEPQPTKQPPASKKG